FYYRIMLENHSSDAVQLVGRHWIFKSNGTETEVPKFSRGVIGVEPIIKPGQNFQYMSMANLEADRGVMAGAFLMKTEATGSPFEVEVAPCAL
ncbi:ApaG domain-containing protein, partial [Ochromonadaceae sp. CCMP2298]